MSLPVKYSVNCPHSHNHELEQPYLTPPFTLCVKAILYFKSGAGGATRVHTHKHIHTWLTNTCLSLAGKQQHHDGLNCSTYLGIALLLMTLCPEFLSLSKDQLLHLMGTPNVDDTGPRGTDCQDDCKA